MPKLIDISGERFERLLVIERADVPKLKPHWLCECDCGRRVVVNGSDLKLHKHRSCGCLHAEWVASNMTRHGLSKHRIYGIWQGMLRRCEVPSFKKFENYGGRGIKVCERWRKFTAFAEDMGLPPTKSHTLDRINNDGNYEPENCRWATDTEQRNNRRDTFSLTFDGQTMSITQWADRLNTRPGSIKWRLQKGYSVDEVLGGKVALPTY